MDSLAIQCKPAAFFRKATDYSVVLMRASHDDFASSGKKLARMELAASWRNSSPVKPCSVWASRYSLAKSDPKKAGSSDFSVTVNPKSKQRRSGWAANEGQTPVRTFDVGHNSSDTARAFNSRISFSS